MLSSFRLAYYAGKKTAPVHFTPLMILDTTVRYLVCIYNYTGMPRLSTLQGKTPQLIRTLLITQALCPVNILVNVFWHAIFYTVGGDDCSGESSS